MSPPEPSRSRPPLSVVIPVLDEAASLEELHGLLARALPREAELIFVDDGSSDATPAVLERMARADSRVRVVRFLRSFGKSMALHAGLRRAQGEIVATLDGDLQDDPADVLKLADKLKEGYDVVGGWRRRRRDPARKVIASRVFNALVSWLSGRRFRDINCGLKVLRREVVEELVLAGGFHRFVPLLAHWKGFRVTEVEVSHRPRIHGASRYGGERALRGLLDLIVVHFLVQGRPARYFAGLGTLLGAAGFAISLYLACVWLLDRTIHGRFPLLSLGLVLMVVGVQLFGMGLFGELLAHHFRAQRPFEPALWEAGRGAARPEGASEGIAREERP